MYVSSGPFKPAADLSPFEWYEPEEWLVPGIIPTGGLVVLASAPKTGKTCFATAIARAVATGTEFLGTRLRQSPVLWCAYEETFRERIPLHEGLTPEDPFLVAYTPQLLPLPHKLPTLDRAGQRDYRWEHPPFVFAHAKKVDAKFIVIDCLHAAVQNVSLADNGVARGVMGSLRSWSAFFGITVLVLHHLTKSATRGHQPERFADSAQILAAASCHHFLERRDETATRSRLVLHGRGRHPAPYPRLELISEGPLDYRLADEKTPEPPRRFSATDRILTLLQDGWPLTVNEIARRLDLTPGTVRNALTQLKENGHVEKSKAADSRIQFAATEKSTNEEFITDENPRGDDDDDEEF